VARFADFFAAHLARVASAVEADEAKDPLDISFACAIAVVADFDFGADGVQETGGGRHEDRETGVDWLGGAW
jgi:hypothetical protein